MFIPCINGQEGSIGTIIIYFKLFRLFLNLQKEMNSVMVTRKKKKKGSVEKMTRRYWNINLKEMIEAGVHFGHGIKKWNPKWPLTSRQSVKVLILQILLEQLVFYQKLVI